MTERFVEVTFTEDVDSIHIKGEEYSFKTGDVATLPSRIASDFVSKAEIAERNQTEAYDVLDEDVTDEIGKVGESKADPDNSSDSNEGGEEDKKPSYEDVKDDLQDLPEALEARNVKQVKEELVNGADEPSYLEQLRQAESETQDRKSVKEAIDARLEELEGSEEGEE